jgi:hypothetical protein
MASRHKLRAIGKRNNPESFGNTEIALSDAAGQLADSPRLRQSARRRWSIAIALPVRL